MLFYNQFMDFTSQNQDNSIHQNKNQTLPRAEIKKMRVDEAVRRRSTKKIIWVVSSIAIFGVFIGGGIWYSRRQEQNLPGQFYESLGQDHIPLGQEPPKPYNSNPPSSGGHYQSPANWGVYDHEIPDEATVHNLEHGGIRISYKPSIPDAAKKKLEEIAKNSGGKIQTLPGGKI